MNSVKFHVAAQHELQDAVDFYNGRSEGLGDIFLNEVQAAVELLAEFPSAGSAYKYGTRRFFPKRFPYSIVYKCFPVQIVIVAVAHFRRKPAYWRSRN
jgi:toxin ParE1/3/4